MKDVCEQVLVSCPEGCGEKHLRGKVERYIDQFVTLLQLDQVSGVLIIKLHFFPLACGALQEGLYSLH